MKYILLVFILNGKWSDSTMSTMTAEFDSRESCEMAYNKLFSKLTDRYVKSSVIYTCTPK